MAVLGKKFVLDNINSTNKTFEEFKKDFQSFIFNEYELLGEDKFYKKYPVRGFDDFLKRK